METTRSLGQSGSERKRFGEAIHRLLDEEKQEGLAERRAHPRHPFFRLVTIALDHKRQMSAFTREISFSGVGLLHNMPLEVGEVVLTIPSKYGNTISVRTQIIWCRPCGEGWYLSGGQFQ